MDDLSLGLSAQDVLTEDDQRDSRYCTQGGDSKLEILYIYRN